jgi:hypothetical protein
VTRLIREHRYAGQGLFRAVHHYVWAGRSFAARVAPSSRGSGYFAIFFLSPATEVARRTIALAPSTVALGTTTTGADGSFTAAVRGLPEGTSLVEAWYRGDGRYFPAYASATAAP